MSPSQPHLRREPRRLNVSAAQLGSNKLQIRVVPYSPPRLSRDTSVSQPSRPASCIGNAVTPLGSPFCDQHAFDNGDDSHLKANESSDNLTVSSALKRTSSRLTLSSACSDQNPDGVSVFSLASSTRPPSSYRAKRVITINPDNRTFSLLPISGSETSRSESFSSSQPSTTNLSGSYGSWGRSSTNTFMLDDRDRETTPLTPLSEHRSYSESPSPSMTPTMAFKNKISIQSWESNMRGGMRTVDKTPDSKHVPRVMTEESTGVSGLSLIGEVPRVTSSGGLRNGDTTSLYSTNSGSTMSERTNYKVYTQSSPVALSERTNYHILGQSSPATPTPRAMTPITVDLEDSFNGSFVPSEPPSSSHSNYEILGTSEDGEQSLRRFQRPETADSKSGHLVLDGPSASCTSLSAVQSQLRSEFSQESLVVPPLRPVKTKKKSFGRSSIFKSRSRESLRKGSLTALGSALSAEATRILFAGPASIVYNRKSNPLASQPVRLWKATPSVAIPENNQDTASQPSPVSSFSSVEGKVIENLPSVASSSTSGEKFTQPHSRTGSLERPAPIFTRNEIRDHDEDGDGITDLQHRPSRTRMRLGSFVSSNSSERFVRSSGSTRSLNPFLFPGWARLYYGSGERRFVIAQASTDSMRSLYNGSMYNQEAPLPPATTRLAHAPNAEKFTRSSSNRTVKSRLREICRVDSTSGEKDAASESIKPPSRVSSVIRHIRKQTSSIWSPHLGHDRRARRYSHWEPPAPVWSMDDGFDWKKNLQIILFVTGFIIPFAWMIAAFLPLPQQPVMEMIHQYRSTSHIDLSQQHSHGIQDMDEARYNSARWWRNLNRVMSVIGLIIIGAVIAMIVVGTHYRWVTS